MRLTVPRVRTLDTNSGPDSSVALSGARNTQTACLNHSARYSNSTVYAQLRDFVR